MPRPEPELETFAPEEMGSFGLFLPFLLILMAVIVLGDGTAMQIAGSLVLLLPPVAILALRRHFHRVRVPS